MEIGMLWFDNEQGKAFSEKVKQAARYYARKYGADPDLCFVHPDMLQRSSNGEEGGKDHQVSEAQVGNVRVQESRKVLPNHFWIGLSNGSK